RQGLAPAVGRGGLDPRAPPGVCRAAPGLGFRSGRPWGRGFRRVDPRPEPVQVPGPPLHRGGGPANGPRVRPIGAAPLLAPPRLRAVRAASVRTDAAARGESPLETR